MPNLCRVRKVIGLCPSFIDFCPGQMNCRAIAADAGFEQLSSASNPIENSVETNILVQRQFQSPVFLHFHISINDKDPRTIIKAFQLVAESNMPTECWNYGGRTMAIGN